MLCQGTSGPRFNPGVAELTTACCTTAQVLGEVTEPIRSIPSIQWLVICTDFWELHRFQHVRRCGLGQACLGDPGTVCSQAICACRADLQLEFTKSPL